MDKEYIKYQFARKVDNIKTDVRDFKNDVVEFWTVVWISVLDDITKFFIPISRFTLGIAESCNNRASALWDKIEQMQEE